MNDTENHPSASQPQSQVQGLIQEINMTIGDLEQKTQMISRNHDLAEPAYESATKLEDELVKIMQRLRRLSSNISL